MAKKDKKRKPAKKQAEKLKPAGLGRLDDASSRMAFYGGFLLIFIGFVIGQLGLAYIATYIFYIIGSICILFAGYSADTPRRFVYLFSGLMIYMLLNQGVSTDLKLHPVWIFRAASFGMLVLFILTDREGLKKILASVNWKHPLLWTTVILIVSGNIITIKPMATLATTLNLAAYAALALLVYSYLRKVEDLKLLLEIIVSIGFVVAFWGLFVFYGGLGNEPLKKPLSTVFYWHNQAAGYLLMIFPICLAMYLSVRDRYQTFQMMWFFFIVFTAFALTLSRGGWLSSFIPLLAIPLWLHYKGELRITKLGGRWGQVVLGLALTAFTAILAVVLWAMLYTVLKLAAPGLVLATKSGRILQQWLLLGLFLFSGAAIFIPAIIKKRFKQVKEGHLSIPARILLLFAVYVACAIPISIARPGKFLKPILDRWNHIRIDDFSAVGRFNFYGAGWEMFMDHPVVGTGFETYGYYYPKYQNDPSYYSKDPHNVYLRFAQEGGLVGVAVVVLFLWQFIGLLRRLGKKEKGNSLAVFQIALAAGILGELQHMFLDFDWTFPILPMMVITFVVLLRNTYSFMGNGDSTGKPKIKSDEIAGRRTGQIRNALLVSSAILCLFCIWVGTSYFYQQKARKIQTDATIADFTADSEGSGRRRGLSAEDQDKILRYNTIAANIFPYNPDALFNLSQDYYQRAKNIYRSVNLVENPDARIIFESNIDQALEYSKRSLVVEGYDPKVNYYHGQILYLIGSSGDPLERETMKNEAFKYIERALELNPVNIPMFYIGAANLYFSEGRNEKTLEKIAGFEWMLESILDVTEREPDWISELAGRRLDWANLAEEYREAMWIKGLVLLQKEDTDGAERAFFKGANTALPIMKGLSMRYQDFINSVKSLVDLPEGADDIAAREAVVSNYTYIFEIEDRDWESTSRYGKMLKFKTAYDNGDLKSAQQYADDANSALHIFTNEVMKLENRDYNFALAHIALKRGDLEDAKDYIELTLSAYRNLDIKHDAEYSNADNLLKQIKQAMEDRDEATDTPPGENE